MDAHGNSCCFESFLPLFFPADFRAKERLLAVYMRVASARVWQATLRKRRIGKKGRTQMPDEMNEQQTS